MVNSLATDITSDETHHYDEKCCVSSKDISLILLALITCALEHPPRTCIDDSSLIPLDGGKEDMRWNDEAAHGSNPFDVSCSCLCVDHSVYVQLLKHRV
ncbi:unnamed protein product [Brassica oleracea var. botrytis]